MKYLHIITVIAVAVTCTVLSVCALFSANSGSLRRTDFSDHTFKDFSEDYYFEPCEKHGIIEKFTYKTRDNQTAGSKEFEKNALVYLPYGYNHSDKSQRYNVMYLMHGYGGSPKDYFGGKEEPKGESEDMINFIDHMIADGKIKPLIICAVSYVTEYNKDVMKSTLDFHHELRKDVIPSFEKKYHTFAKNTDQEGLVVSRGHRAFAGFSMGGCCTWAVFEHCLDIIGYYMPISGDYWALQSKKSSDTAKHLADAVAKAGKTSADFKIYTGCGHKDFAEAILTPLINEMKKYPDTFQYTENFSNGNLYQLIYDKGPHNIYTIMRVMYNGLPNMFD